MIKFEKVTRFDDVRAGDRVRWYAVGGIGQDASVSSVKGDVIKFDFGRADMRRNEFAAIGACGFRRV